MHEPPWNLTRMPWPRCPSRRQGRGRRSRRRPRRSARRTFGPAGSRTMPTRFRGLRCRRGRRPNAFTHLFEIVWEVGEKRASHEPGQLIATPLTSPLPAKRRGEGARASRRRRDGVSGAFVENRGCRPLPASLRGEGARTVVPSRPPTRWRFGRLRREPRLAVPSPRLFAGRDAMGRAAKIVHHRCCETHDGALHAQACRSEQVSRRPGSR